MKPSIKLLLSAFLLLALAACRPKPEGEFTASITNAQLVELFKPEAKSIATGTGLYAISNALGASEHVDVSIDFETGMLEVVSRSPQLKDVAAILSAQVDHSKSVVAISSPQTGRVARFELKDAQTLVAENGVVFRKVK